MANLGGVNLDDVEADKGGGGGPLHPVGSFELEMSESDVKPTKNGKGLIMTYVLRGIGTDNKDAKVFGNINIKNESAQAQQIGQAQLKALCLAIGVEGTPEDTDDLMWRPFWAEIGHEQSEKKDPVSNRYVPAFNEDGSPKMRAYVRRFLFEGCDEAPRSATPPASKAAPSNPPAQPAQAAAGGTRRPWGNR